MKRLTMRAHFDGKQILLDEPFEIEPNTALIVTILPKSSNGERENWARLSFESLARAYGGDEPECSLDLIKKANLEGSNKESEGDGKSISSASPLIKP